MIPRADTTLIIRITPPICGAKNRRGQPCGLYPCKNGRCKFHGGKSTGPRTKEGKDTHRAAVKKALTRHGRYCKDRIAENQKLNLFFRGCRKVIKDCPKNTFTS